MLTGISVEEAEDMLEEDYAPVGDTNSTGIAGYKYCKDKERQFLDVELEIIQGEKTANISFEYDIQQAKGYNFSYEI